MKCALVLSSDSEMFIHVRDALVEAGAASAADTVQILDEGYLFNLFGNLGSAFDYDLNEPITEWRGEGEPPDIASASVCYVECRSETVFIRWVEFLAGKLPAPVWVLDSDDVLWDACNIDPLELRL